MTFQKMQLENWKAGDLIRFKTYEEFKNEFGEGIYECEKWGGIRHGFNCDGMGEMLGLSGRIINAGRLEKTKKADGTYQYSRIYMEIELYDPNNPNTIIYRAGGEYSWTISSDMLVNETIEFKIGFKEVVKNIVKDFLNKNNNVIRNESFDETLI